MFEVSYFSIENAVEKTDLVMNALSTQHTKPKAACAKRRGAIRRCPNVYCQFCPSFVQLLYCPLKHDE